MPGRGRIGQEVLPGPASLSSLDRRQTRVEGSHSTRSRRTSPTPPQGGEAGGPAILATTATYRDPRRQIEKSKLVQEGGMAKITTSPANVSNRASLGQAVQACVCVNVSSLDRWALPTGPCRREPSSPLHNFKPRNYFQKASNGSHTHPHTNSSRSFLLQRQQGRSGRPKRAAGRLGDREEPDRSRQFFDTPPR